MSRRSLWVVSPAMAAASRGAMRSGGIGAVLGPASTSTGSSSSSVVAWSGMAATGAGLVGTAADDENAPVAAEPMIASAASGMLGSMARTIATPDSRGISPKAAGATDAKKGDDSLVSEYEAAKNDPKAQAKFMGLMRSQADRMRRLIDDLLSLSRIEMNEHVRPSGEVDLTQVAAHVRDVLSGLAKDFDCALTLESDGPLIIAGSRDGAGGREGEEEDLRGIGLRLDTAGHEAHRDEDRQN